MFDKKAKTLAMLMVTIPTIAFFGLLAYHLNYINDFETVVEEKTVTETYEIEQVSDDGSGDNTVEIGKFPNMTWGR